MILRFKKFLPALVGLIAIGACGCGERELPMPDRYPVRGTLTMHGEPARYVIITLAPVEGEKGAKATGTTSHDGTFEIRTLSNNEPDGAMPGEYEVVLDPGMLPRDAPEGVTPTDFTGEFRTGIVVVVEKKENDFEIDIP